MQGRGVHALRGDEPRVLALVHKRLDQLQAHLLHAARGKTGGRAGGRAGGWVEGKLAVAPGHGRRRGNKASRQAAPQCRPAKKVQPILGATQSFCHPVAGSETSAAPRCAVLRLPCAALPATLPPPAHELDCGGAGGVRPPRGDDGADELAVHPAAHILGG